MILQERKIQREEAILSSLKKLDYLSRGQLQRLHDLGGERNARRVLANMNDYVSTFRCETGENVFYLSKAGREQIGCETVRQKTNQVGHYLMRNDLYIRYRPESWKNEMRIRVGDELTIVCDAYFKHQQRLHFLEADHLQHMNKNKQKIERYRALKETGVYQDRYKYFPRLIWITLTEGRKRQMIEWCAGLDHQVYTWEELR